MWRRRPGHASSVGLCVIVTRRGVPVKRCASRFAVSDATYRNQGYFLLLLADDPFPPDFEPEDFFDFEEPAESEFVAFADDADAAEPLDEESLEPEAPEESPPFLSYPSAYQPPPLRWKALAESSFWTAQRHSGQRLRGSSLMLWRYSKTPHLRHSYS